MTVFNYLDIIKSNNNYNADVFYAQRQVIMLTSYVPVDDFRPILAMLHNEYLNYPFIKLLLQLETQHTTILSNSMPRPQFHHAKS